MTAALPGLDWRHRALCAGAGASLWDEVSPAEIRLYGIVQRRHPRIVRALSICHACPVEAECLADAMAHTDYTLRGVRGGVYFDRRTGEKVRRAAKARSAVPVLAASAGE